MSVQAINIKNHTYYFFDDIVNIKDIDPNNIKTDGKSYKNIFICNIGYVTNKKDLEIYSAKPLYLIFGKVNGYFEEINGNKYLTLVTTNESQEKIKKYKEIWSKVGDLVKSITENSDDYGEKYM